MGINGLVEFLKEQKVTPEETLAFVDDSALVTSITVPAALQVINRELKNV